MMVRFGGFCKAIVAKAPTFISSSPSPVATSTRRLGWASARPRPIMGAAPIAPPRPNRLGDSWVSADSSQAVPARPATMRKSPGRSINAGTASRRSSTASGKVAVWSLLNLAMNVCSLEFLGTDQALGEQNGDLVAGLERHGDGGAHARNDIVGMFCSQHDYPHRLQHRFHRLAHGELPGITLAEFASHRDQRQQREAASLSERKHIDAVADAR